MEPSAIPTPHVTNRYHVTVVDNRPNLLLLNDAGVNDSDWKIGIDVDVGSLSTDDGLTCDDLSWSMLGRCDGVYDGHPLVIRDERVAEGIHNDESIDVG
jgi:hypothetical protein